MSVSNIQAGDVVQLKSGGPYMTVAWIEEGEACCEWFDGKKNAMAKFPLTSLGKSTAKELKPNPGWEGTL